jgi:long-subunit acyl-CoA synthetase (AMP-forming)
MACGGVPSVDPFRVHAKWGKLDPASEVEGFGQCLWNIESERQTCKEFPDSGAKTLVEVLKNSVAANGTRNAVGSRKLIETHMVADDKGVKREKLQFANEYKHMTYTQYGDMVSSLAKGFATSGLSEGQNSRLVIYAETQKEWMACAFAAWHCNAQVVTIYATLGEEGAIYGINQTKAAVVVADAKLMKILVKILPSCPSVKTVVSLTAVDDATVKTKIKDAGAELLTLDEVTAKGKSSSAELAKPESKDVAVIMYTSGTTGTPKGVRISHANICAAVAGVEHMVKGLVTNQDVYLAYLPLAHIMEMVAEICFLAFGARLDFGSPHTLTDTGVKLKRPESDGDSVTSQPTFMVFAPAVLDKVYQGVQNKKEGMKGAVQTLFNWGLQNGEKHFDRGQVGANWFFNSVVFKKVQGLVGGKLKAMITGSAPLSPDIQKFCQTVFSAPVRQGYGLTETCAGSCVGFWGDSSTSTVGPPVLSAVIRLADWAEGNYRNSDKDNKAIGMRRGEVLIGGPAVTLGYYIDPENPDEELKKKNEEDWIMIKDMRFFRTGDIGQITDKGCLQIIDRKKDLWKGPNGEYVALTKVEAALKLCEYCEMPMCYGKTGGEYPVALICPQKPKIMNLGEELKVTGSYEQLCVDPKIVDTVSKALIAQCKASKLIEFEIPKKYALIAEAWTPENDLLTAAMKLKRPIIADKHKDEIAKLY